MSIGEKLLTVTEKMKDVYGCGHASGYSKGYEKGYQEGGEAGHTAGFNNGYNSALKDGEAAGRKAEREEFWEINQQGGKRENYQYAYIGYGFDFDNFYPLYDIRPVGPATAMFFHWSGGKRHADSLKDRLKECGVTLDTSQATSVSQLFYNSEITQLPAITLPEGAGNTYCFAKNPYLFLIDKVIVGENTAFSSCFAETPNLKEVRFEGVIGQNGLDLSDSPLLSAESLRSVLSCLKTLSGESRTLTLGSENLAKLTEEEKAAAAAKGWTLK